MRTKEICKKAVDTWGKEAQLRMMFEEMAELQIALCETERKTKNPKEGAVAEEIVDVEFMIGQMKYMFKISEEELDKIRVKKIEKINNYLKNTK